MPQAARARCLNTAFNACPDPGAQALVLGIELGRQEQPRTNLWRRVDGGIIADLRINQWLGGKVVVAVVDVVGDCCDHVRIEDEVDEFVRRARVWGPHRVLAKRCR